MNIQATEDKYFIPVYTKRDIAIVKGRGVFVFDENGKKYLDLTSNYGITILGHSNKAWRYRIQKQLKKISNVHSSFYNETRAQFLSLLHSLIPQTHSFISSSGAEAVEAAIKFARLVTGKTNIIAAKAGFHGRTMGALSATGVLKYKKGFEPLVPGFTHVGFNSIDELQNAFDGNVAAVILEPIQGEAGVIIPDKDYLTSVKRICEQNNALLILDEVQSAFRTGTLLASEQFNTVSDMLCLSKGLGNGFPIGITAVSNEIAEKISKGAHSTTFGGNPISCVAALTTLEQIQKHNLLENVQEIGEYFLQQLRTIKSLLIREVRGKGLMIAIELKQKPTLYVKQLQEQGILVIVTRNVIRLLPPLILNKKHVDIVINKFKKILC